MKVIARVNPRYFAAINLFAADKDVRYYLCGVRIEPHPEKGVVLIATNGHVMGVAHDPDGFCSEPIIVGDISKQLITACCARNGIVKGVPPKSLYITDGGAIVDFGDIAEHEIDPFGKTAMHSSRIALVDGQFPNWRRVLPVQADSPEKPATVAAHYLSLLEKVVKAFGVQRYCPGVMLRYADGKAIVVRIGAPELDERFAAVIMQLRNDNPPDSHLPEWLMPKEEPNPAA